MFWKLYKMTEETEEKEGCPLIIAGIFFNTAVGNPPALSAEAMGINGTGAIIETEEELIEFLEENGRTINDIQNAIEK